MALNLINIFFVYIQNIVNFFIYIIVLKGNFMYLMRQFVTHRKSVWTGEIDM